MTEEELNSLIAHAHRRIDQLQRQVAEYEVRVWTWLTYLKDITVVKLNVFVRKFSIRVAL